MKAQGTGVPKEYRSEQPERKVKIAIVQQAWYESKELHLSKLENSIVIAAKEGAQLVLLQELTLHRYFGDVRDSKYFDIAEEIGTEPYTHSPTLSFGSMVSRKANVHVILSVFEKEKRRENNKEETVKYFNTAIIFDNQGKLIGKTRKQHIPKGEGYHEDFYFIPGDSDYPVHDLGFIKLAIPTCYDQWFPELARIYALKGAELIFYPTAIGSEPLYPGFSTKPMWHNVMIGHAIASGVFIAASNRVDNEGTVTFYGSSFVCNPMGEIIAQLDDLHDSSVTVTLDFNVFHFWRSLFPLLTQRQPTTYTRLLTY